MCLCSYVMGPSSRAYDEVCVRQLWNGFDIARAFVEDVEGAELDHFDAAHLEVLYAATRDLDFSLAEEEWYWHSILFLCSDRSPCFRMQLLDELSRPPRRARVPSS